MFMQSAHSLWPSIYYSRSASGVSPMLRFLPMVLSQMPLSLMCRLFLMPLARPPDWPARWAPLFVVFTGFRWMGGLYGPMRCCR